MRTYRRLLILSMLITLNCCSGYQKEIRQFAEVVFGYGVNGLVQENGEWRMEKGVEGTMELA